MTAAGGEVDPSQTVNAQSDRNAEITLTSDHGLRNDQAYVL